MAPDRGSPPPAVATTSLPPLPAPPATPPPHSSTPSSPRAAPGSSGRAASARAPHFTARGLAAGLAIGTLICFSNTYFGLQTGWISSMAMPSALLGYSVFRALPSVLLATPFTPAENVLVQSVAGAAGTMPLGAGFVGVLPALEFLLGADEGAPLRFGFGTLVVWAAGLAFFGVVFAVPLRRQVIVRERLKFPSGTAAAALIELLHGRKELRGERMEAKGRGLVGDFAAAEVEQEQAVLLEERPEPESEGVEKGEEWRKRMRLLLHSFVLSAAYTLLSYFIPLNEVPVFGSYLAETWLWTVNFSPAYVGQGIIMGAPTTLAMLIGAIVGYGILSPLAKTQGWAPGPIDDWGTGSKGWIVWISLAIMLADSLINLSWLVLRPLLRYARRTLIQLRILLNDEGWQGMFNMRFTGERHYTALRTPDSPGTAESVHSVHEDDAPPEHLISTRTTIIGLAISCILCVSAVHITFADLIPFGLTLLALAFAMLLSIMGVRALGETDLNPVSGISKLTQLFFALVTPRGSKSAVVINLIAGALSESGALQAGDLMQDLKTGHLIGASPSAQFYGQIIGCAFGAVVASGVYKLYTSVYEIPGDLFQIPTAYVWIYTARLVTGQGLPPMVAEWAVGAAILFSFSTMLRIWLNTGSATAKAVSTWIPGGIAVAVGMYNTPSFTIARATGGFISWYWKRYRGKEETPIIVIASGLILGEGLFSIINLVLASMKVPHL